MANTWNLRRNSMQWRLLYNMLELIFIAVFSLNEYVRQ